MLKRTTYPIAAIRVPVKRVKTLDPAKVRTLAESIMAEGQTAPISLRANGDGFVLIEGYHRLEALKALGETTVDAFLVHARLH